MVIYFINSKESLESLLKNIITSKQFFKEWGLIFNMKIMQ